MKAALALLALLSASPAVAAEPQGAPCLTAAEALSNALSHGAVAGRLDGAEAQALLDRLNRIPPETDLRAASVVVVLRPDRAIVAMFGACHVGDVALPLAAFAVVWRAARGMGV